MDSPPPAIFPPQDLSVVRHEFRQLILMVRLLLSAAVLATFAAPALGHMGMTIVKGGATKFPRDKAKGDAYRYPNYPMCHGVAKVMHFVVIASGRGQPARVVVLCVPRCSPNISH